MTAPTGQIHEQAPFAGERTMTTVTRADLHAIVAALQCRGEHAVADAIEEVIGEAPPAEPDEVWSEWLSWRGREECPLPPETPTEVWLIEGGIHTGYIRSGWTRIIRFRYRCLPGGWIERPAGWTPPASLWEPVSPVQCWWTTIASPCHLREGTSKQIDDWTGVLYIRLLPREPAALTESTLREMIRDPRYWRDREPAFVRAVATGYRDLYPDSPVQPEPVTQMPAGFTIDRGRLLDPRGRIVVASTLDNHTEATILAAVTAWCDAMKERP